MAVNFTGSASDSDGTVTSYQWDFDGNGSWDKTTSGNTASHTYTAANYYTAKMRVKDNDGAWSNACSTNVWVQKWTDNWLQVVGGGVYSRGGLDVSYIPHGQSFCQKNGKIDSGVVWSSGGMTMGGMLSGSGWQVGSDGGQQTLVFYDLRQRIQKQGQKIGNGTLNDNLDSGVYYRQGDLLIKTNQTKGATIMLVDGNLTIDSQVTELDGVYIATGSIIFANGGGDEGTVTVQGELVADADQNGQGDLVIRRYLDSSNRTKPAVKVVYRPDWLFSWQSWLWQPAVEMKEVLP